MAAGDVWRSIAVFNDDASGKLFTTHLDGVEGVGGVALSTIGDAWVNWWTVGAVGGVPGGMRTIADDAISLQKVTLRKIKPLSATVQEYTTGLPSVGADTEGLPSSTCVIVSLRTDLVGRSFRGRMYLFPVSEADALNGNITATLAAAIREQTIELQTELATALTGFEPAVYSRKLNSAEPITLTLVDQRMRTQRRRQERRPNYV